MVGGGHGQVMSISSPLDRHFTKQHGCCRFFSLCKSCGMVTICTCSFTGSEHVVHCLINLGEVRDFAIVVDVDFLVMMFGLLFVWLVL